MKNKPTALYSAKVTYANISDIHEPVGLNGGDIEETRWDLDSPKVRKAYDELITSIAKNGFLVGTVAVQLPKDVTLFRTRYVKGDWIAIDVNGRVRALKDMIESGNYTLNPDTNIENQVPVVDVTHLVITDNKIINEDIIEKLWQTIVKLNTGQLKWTDYDFISSGSRAIRNPKQVIVWKYLTNIMKQYHPDLSNKVVLAATINKLTDNMKRKAYIDFNMEYKRYSDIILKRLLEIRKAQGSSNTPAPFLRVLANYFRLSSTCQAFIGCEYNDDGSPKKGSSEDCFGFAGNLYEDEHFFEFERKLEYITNSFIICPPPTDGFSAVDGAALKQIHKYVLHFNNQLQRSI